MEKGERARPRTPHTREQPTKYAIMKRHDTQPQPISKEGAELPENTREMPPAPDALHNEEPQPRKVVGVPFTSENAREMARRSNEAQARKKRRGEILQKLLDGKTNDPDTLKECERLGIPADEITTEAAICVAMIRQAMAGDPKGSPKAAEWVAKVSGMLIERHELTGAEGAPLIPPRTLTPSEVAEYLRELEKEY